MSSRQNVAFFAAVDSWTP